MEKTVNIAHRQLLLKSTFESFTDRLENVVLNHLETGWAETLKKDIPAFRAYIDKLGGNTGLMLFAIQDHGLLLSALDAQRKAKQYVIGNPMTAIKMTGVDIRAALYAPLHILVYEDTDGKLFAEYDLPSTLFGQFGEKVLEIGKLLDQKILDVIELADTIV
jgi:uncharacterized protein (DUF302 family)